MRWATTDAALTVGFGACLIWPEINLERQHARFGVLDLAGNFSGWTELDIELPSVAEAQQTLVDAQAEATREAVEREARRPESQPRGAFEGHMTGCSVASPSPWRTMSAMSGITLAALLGVGVRRRARRA